MEIAPFHIGSSTTSHRSKKVRTIQTQFKHKTQKTQKTQNTQDLLKQIYNAHREIDPVALGRTPVRKEITFFNTTAPGLIAIILPNKNKQNTQNTENASYTIAHNSIKYLKKTYNEWFLEMKAQEFGYSNKLYGDEYLRWLNIIFAENQKLRWAFKRLYLARIKKLCEKKKIGYESDLIKYEPLIEKNRIQIYCLKSRCIYYFSANALINSVKANLETQVHSLAVLVFPKNPLTNDIFDYGQMLHIYDECLRWCAEHSKPLPTSIAFFRNENFQLNRISKLYNTYLQHRASKNYLINDDENSDLFLDDLGSILQKHTLFLHINLSQSKNIRTSNFREWLKRDPNNHLIKQWRSFVTDYMFHVETKQYVREHWKTLASVLTEFMILFKASLPYILSSPRSSAILTTT